MKTLRSFATVLVLGALFALIVERFAGAPANATTPDPRIIAMLTMGDCVTCPGDLNGDNIVNSADLSVILANFGNVCANDTDGDGIPNNQDNCPNTPNADQSDNDQDQVGNACDNCPNTVNINQQDSDNDGIGDTCEGAYCQMASQCPTVPNAQPICAGTQCQYACDVGYADCNGNMLQDGCEVAILSDNTNCGGCGFFCPSGHVCVNGQCVLQCPSGFTNCGGQCKNLLTDSQNCGACGNVCAFANATGACVNGQCVIGSCNTGFADCNSIAADGCEVNLNTNNNHCGGCGMVCPTRPNAVSFCSNGQCVLVCNAGWANCDGNPINGCEVNLFNDVNHCNACGNMCVPTAHVTSVACVNGVCKITGCQTNWIDQNGIYADGCEVFNNPN